MEDEMKDLRLEIEELEQRVVPSRLGAILTVAVTLPDAASDTAAPAPSAAVNAAAAAANGAGGVVSVSLV
jgi:hypothetical protein